LLLWLRWRLFRNSLTSRKRQAEIALGAIGYLFIAFFVFSATVGLYFGTIAALHAGKFVVLEAILWGVFLFWQFVPIMFEGYSPGLNFREVARYPVSLRLYLLLNAVYGLFDPAALAAMLWLLSIWLGILTARPEWALSAAGLFVVFVALNVLINRIVIGVFERFQSTRKGRERMVAVLLLLMLIPQIFNMMANGWINVHRFKRFHLPHWIFDTVVVIRSISPPRLILQILSPGDTQLLLLSLALLLAYPLLTALVQYRQLRAVYQGEIYAESFKVKRELKVKPGWQLPGMDAAVSAIFEKELRYIRQNSRLVVALVYPLVLFAFLLVGPGGRVFSLSKGGNILAAFAGFLALAVSNIAYNTFGMDAEGFGRWLLLPLPLQKIMWAKNLAQGALMFAIYLLGAGIILTVGHVPLDMLAAVTAGFLSLLIIHLGAGSLLSVYWPRRIDFTKMTSRMTSSASGFAALAILLPMAAISGIVVFATAYWHLTWLPLVAGLAGLLLSFKIYSWLLHWAVRHAQDHLEEISGQLGA
jgi:hypothetical protein